MKALLKSLKRPNIKSKKPKVTIDANKRKNTQKAPKTSGTLQLQKSERKRPRYPPTMLKLIKTNVRSSNPNPRKTLRQSTSMIRIRIQISRQANKIPALQVRATSLHLFRMMFITLPPFKSSVKLMIVMILASSVGIQAKKMMKAMKEMIASKAMITLMT